MKTVVTYHGGDKAIISVPSKQASYRPSSIKQSLREAVNASVTGSEVINLDNPVGVQAYGLVELKLQELFSALLESVESEPTHMKGVVIRPSVKLCFQIADSDSRVIISHSADNISNDSLSTQPEKEAA